VSEPPIPHRAGFVDGGPERIYYEESGAADAPAVVLSHGAGGNHASWFQQVPVLAREFRVITWDQRGFGRTANLAGNPGPRSAAEDLARLLDALEIRRAHLIAQSMGGWAALGFALAQPSRVVSLVLADTIGGIYTPEVEQAFDAFIRSLASSPPPDALPLGVHPALGELHRRDPALAFLYQQLASLAEPAPAQVGLLLRQTAQDPAAIARLDLPVLFVVGAQDRIFPPHAIRSAAARLRRATVVEIADAGHSPYFERAGEWNRAVLDFLHKHAL
jgi:2-succinyl-6-hydroxy-2,4-cyclohexadiene-1-carboxylate synthase